MCQKAIITLTDTQNGSITVKIDFEPLLDPKSEASPSTIAALQFVEFLKQTADKDN